MDLEVNEASGGPVSNIKQTYSTASSIQLTPCLFYIAEIVEWCLNG